MNIDKTELGEVKNGNQFFHAGKPYLSVGDYKEIGLVVFVPSVLLYLDSSGKVESSGQLTLVQGYANDIAWLINE